ncbi:MFS general substrate transporter [Xylariomycetidae sp. FL0641]|nr:MFS general substrate transporter [Xylariomycetidae sp. FL0641]
MSQAEPTELVQNTTVTPECAQEANSRSRLEKDVGATSSAYESRQTYLRGSRLYTIVACLSMCLFLTNLEIPIVTTALVDLTDDLGGFSKASWVISSYLLGYVGFLVIFAKLSDIFGRKFYLLLVLLLFAIFSAACGAAQTINQLIVFRAFQGVGGGGNYALSTVILIELVPSREYAKYASAVSVVYSLSLLLGPILGGAISQHSTWRWIFLLNIPPAALTAIVIYLSIPNGFPFHGRALHERPYAGSSFSQRLRRLDIVGTALLLLAVLTLVAPLEEAGLRSPWRSALVITLLTISGLSWLAFFAWERYNTFRNGIQEPIFPWRFMQSRVWIGMILNAVFLGAPFFCTIFQLPQRFQIVNGLSPVEAGLRFIPFTVASPVGSAVAPAISKLGKVPPIYLVIAAAFLQVVGLALLSTLPNSQEVVAAQYGYQVIAGFGCGVNIALLLVLTPFCVQERDKAVAMGSITQFRLMGGAIGLAIITTAFNNLVSNRLGGLVANDQLEALLHSPDTISLFPGSTQEAIRTTFSDGYGLQMAILSGLAAGQIPAAFLMWKRQQIMI